MDIDFLSLDINPCPLSIGNEPPNYFESTARCKSSTMVSRIGGWGGGGLDLKGRGRDDGPRLKWPCLFLSGTFFS